MDMASASPASTAGMAMPSTTGTSSMDMDMGMGGSSCKISMLWNWNTVDACFISSSWHITSRGMFAGSCIGVILLVVSLEFLRRLGREYDRYIVGQFKYQNITATSAQENASMSSSSEGNTNNHGKNFARVDESATGGTDFGSRGLKAAPFRPNVFQQMIRAALHMVQFGVAYFIMLLAMYYNGYFIICILIGAFIGAFVFSWEQVATR
ncbi:Copper Transporter integral membrane protein that functions in high affinity copper transport [Pseudocyphellaria aurata]|nr:Copper Transporter integral membrane protein that functions in high affinity copper transport [Pseudocyphellaria aurata]